MKTTVYLLLMFLFAGCASFSKIGAQTMKVTVDSIAREGHNSQLATVYVEDRTATSNDLEKEFYTSRFKRFLTEKGIKLASSPAESNQVIYFNRESSPKEITQHTPIFNYSQPQSYSVAGANGQTLGTVSQNGGGQFNYAGDSTSTYTLFYNYVNIVCFDTKKMFEAAKKSDNLNKATVWQTSLSSATYSGDLKYVFPMMLQSLDSTIQEIKTGRTEEVVFVEPK